MSSLLDRIDRTSHSALVARLSLLLLVVNTNEQPVVMIVSIIACAVLFLRDDLLKRPWPWFALAAFVGTAQLIEWWRIDDHVAVTTYWIIVIGLSRLADDPKRFLADSARVLIGLVFALAFGWKLLSSQYLSGDFFRYELIADERFGLVAEHVGGTESEILDQERRSIDSLVATGSADERVPITEGPRNGEVAWVFTAWGLFIEGVIAAAHLLPLRNRWRLLRLISLFAFSYTTYVVVPVAGFGALLMTLALAMHDTPRRRRALVGSFTLLLAWGATFPSLL